MLISRLLLALTMMVCYPMVGINSFILSDIRIISILLRHMPSRLYVIPFIPMILEYMNVCINTYGPKTYVYLEWYRSSGGTLFKCRPVCQRHRSFSRAQAEHVRDECAHEHRPSKQKRKDVVCLYSIAPISTRH